MGLHLTARWTHSATICLQHTEDRQQCIRRQAIAYDPLTASMLSLAEIKQMVNEMLAQNRDYLPTFEHFEV
jgi:alpha-galactosidase/6-phospho-beta-glucosidase family protein